MTKQQRELLLFFGILVVLGGILVLRFSGGDETVAPPGQSAAATGTAGQPGPGSTPGGPTQPGTGPGSLTVDQVPIEMLDPALSDSAVTARIMTGSITNPFAANRRTAPARPPTRRTEPEPEPVERTTERITHEEWPDELNYGGISEKADAPGVFRVRINGEYFEQGDTVTGTGWEIRELAARLVRLYKFESRGTTDYYHYFQHVIPPPRGSFR